MHGAQPIKIPAASGLFGPTAPNGYVVLTGITGVETGGAAVIAVVIREGGATGTVVAAFHLPLSGADTVHFEPVKCAGQMYCQLIGAGVIDGSVHVH